MQKKMNFVQLAPEIPNAEPTPKRLIAAEVTNLIVELAIRLSRQDSVDQKDDRTLRYELDLDLGSGILCRQAVTLVVALAQLCQTVKDGKNKKQVSAYLNRRLNLANYRTGLTGRDLLASIAEKVEIDLKWSAYGIVVR